MSLLGRISIARRLVDFCHKENSQGDGFLLLPLEAAARVLEEPL